MITVTTTARTLQIRITARGQGSAFKSFSTIGHLSKHHQFCPQVTMAHLKDDAQLAALKKAPMLRFGVVADVQYADNDDKQAWYNPTKTRFYRNSLKQIEKAFEHWEKLTESEQDSAQKEPSEAKCPVSFILQLGDIIDKLNTNACSHTAIDRTLSCFLNNPKMPTFHTVGNHELYNFNRQQMSYLFDKYLFQHSHSEHSFGVNNPKAVSHIEGDTSHPLYYKFYPYEGVKFISLDTYDISVLGYEETHPKYEMAAQILEQYHGRRDDDLWDTDQMLRGKDRRFQSSNGALSEEQLSWLDTELTDSDRRQEIVIVFGHVGLHPGSCDWDSLLWNYERVLDLFNNHTSVVAYFSGHAHNAGYAVEESIHYVVYHGVIETAPTQDAFATVTLFPDKMLVDGRGVEQTLTLHFADRSCMTADKEKTLPLGEGAEGEKSVCTLDGIEEIAESVVQCVMEVEVEV